MKRVTEDWPCGDLPNGFTGQVHQLDAKVGGTYKMSFTNFTTGKSHSFGGEYLELTPNERIRHTDRFDDANLPGEMQTTITLKQIFENFSFAHEKILIDHDELSNKFYADTLQQLT